MNLEFDGLKSFLSCPLKSGDGIFDRFAGLEGAVLRGRRPQRFLYLPGSRPDRVLLAAHADTWWDDPESAGGPNRFSEEDGVIRAAKGAPGLGADDRAGCAMLWALMDLGHSLLINDGEERGRMGSRFLMEDPSNRDIAEEINEGHGFAVQFDRRNARDFKCYDVGTDEFRSYVAKMTGYAEPDRSSFTDIVSICRRMPGVNLSVGYYDEHGPDERLVLDEWRNTLEMAREWLSKPLSRFLLTEPAMNESKALHQRGR